MNSLYATLICGVVSLCIVNAQDACSILGLEPQCDR